MSKTSDGNYFRVKSKVWAMPLRRDHNGGKFVRNSNSLFKTFVEEYIVGLVRDESPGTTGFYTNSEGTISIGTRKSKGVASSTVARRRRNVAWRTFTQINRVSKTSTRVSLIPRWIRNGFCATFSYFRERFQTVVTVLSDTRHHIAGSSRRARCRGPYTRVRSAR